MTGRLFGQDRGSLFGNDLPQAAEVAAISLLLVVNVFPEVFQDTRENIIMARNI